MKSDRSLISRGFENSLPRYLADDAVKLPLISFGRAVNHCSRSTFWARDEYCVMKHQNLSEIIELIKSWFGVHYGDRVSQIVLYGSQARGEAKPDSDIDILIVLRQGFDYAQEIERTSEFIQELSLRYDTVISRAFISDFRFNHEKSPFLLNVHQEGIDLSRMNSGYCGRRRGGV